MGGQQPQESTGGERTERHVDPSGRLKPDVGHIGRSQEGQVHNSFGKRMFFGTTRWRTVEHARGHDRTKSGRLQF